ncbi:two-component regulator propeller domain-containing protein [Tamlana sp. 2_MG-2023]|uniref:hybrid sensor histidine kinase/response regulator transcription factor n=1 Tax=unclassified Tamlana TaxID=2614803 RepID=UPI0026E24ABB|nr:MULTISPECIES: hybrid sensor histidine kinase/response regulator transcription factor [unclassified Tamlana]MDO6759929.1 two-component regulator propeller domain-containing protein [Tamlana sp. 2_MG-2023]MDO6791901.1 two-component regulator propeller domain-containing protein [Tamlana sp. 1_MG-2023]
MKQPLLITILLLSVFNSLAQGFVFENISNKEGLSQNDVNCILQDKQGLMWFGTKDGLNRYDGYDFKSYHFNPEKGEGLNSNMIQCLSEDKYGNIWIGTLDRGVNIIKAKDEAVINVGLPSLSTNLLEKENINGIDIYDDLVLIFTKEKIFFLRISETGYTPLKIQDEYFVKTGAFATNCFQRISDREFILGTTNGIKRLRLYENELNVVITTEKKILNVLDITPFRSGYLISSVGKLFYLNPSDALQEIASGGYEALFVENDHAVWAGSKHGLQYLKFSQDNSLDFERQTFTYKSTNGRIGSEAIKSIYKDELGIVWLGTLGGGVTKVLNQKYTFHLFHDDLQSDNLKNNYINCFYEDSKANLWIGTNKGGISYFKSDNFNYNVASKDIFDSNKHINDIICFHELEIENQATIIASTNYPLNVQVYNTKGEKVENSNLSRTLQSVTHPITCMVSDEQYLWLGTNEGGLLRYNYHEDTLRRFLVSNTPSLINNLIRSICLDSKNRMWIGTAKGLLLLNAKEQHEIHPKFKLYQNTPGERNSLSYNYVLSIVETSAREIWIATLGGGVNKYTEETDSFSRITTENGLPNNNIKGIVEDQEKQLWFSSNKGLSCLNPATGQIFNFGVSDGLQDDEFRELSLVKRKTGELLFGGNKGFNAFCPKKIEVDSTMPTMMFTDFQLPKYSGKLGVTLNRTQLAAFKKANEVITLNYDENSFIAYFTALDYFAPQKIDYKCRLTGFDKNWQTIDTQGRFVKYTNLDPGDYTLEVLATNSDGIWAKEPLTLSLKIDKPWYRTVYAYLGFYLGVMLLIYYYQCYITKRSAIKHELAMERFEKEKQKELSEIKFRFFTDVSHELRTPLAVIKSYFEDLKPNWTTWSKEKVNQDFSVIGKNIDSLLGLVGQILDFRKLDEGKMKLRIKKTDVIAFTHMVMASFSVLARQKNINLKVIPSAKAIFFWFDSDMMYKIINNLLSNAIKYTPENGAVTVCITELDAKVKIEIKDTGIGISEEEKYSVFERFYKGNNIKSMSNQSTGIGLSLVKDLVSLHKGSLELESTVGKGSNFILYFKKGNEHFDADVVMEMDHAETIVDNSHEVTIEDRNGEGSFSLKYKTKLILLVEDNNDLRTFLREKLKDYFKVITAANGKIGLEKCIDRIPDMVISDIMMPEMNGYELCNSIKNHEAISHIPVLLLTAKANTDSRIKGLHIGADAYMDKPFNWDVLLAQIISILAARDKVSRRISDNTYFKTSEIEVTNRDEEFLNSITNFIEENISDASFTVKHLVKMYPMSQDTINNKIKTLTGKTTVQYIRYLRLRKATQLLVLKNSRISEVTYSVGYTDLQHFRVHFKKEFSLTPSAYKEKFSK